MTRLPRSTPAHAAALTVLALVASLAARLPAQTAPATAQPPAATAQPPATPLPAATDVLKKYRTAIGGEAAIRKHTFRTISGFFEIPAQGMKGELTILAAAPDRMKLSISLAGLGNLERGYDGKVGWSIDPAVGPRLLLGRELDELKHSADFYDDLHDPSKYTSIIVVSQGLFEGEDCYEVQLVRTSGFTYNEFFSVKSGLLTGVKMNATSQMGTVPVTTVVSEYKPFGGVLTPTITHQKMMGFETVTTITAVSFDPVDAKVFALPPSISALAGQSKE
jgi:zinc protease